MKTLIESLDISSSPYINALIFLLVFTLVAKVADLLVDKVLRKFSKFTKTDIDDRIVDLIHRPIFYSIFLAGLAQSIANLRPEENIAFYLNGSIYSVITLIWCVTAIRISLTVVKHFVYEGHDITGLSKDVAPLIENVLKIVIILGSLMVILSIWRINITPLLASAGIAGVAIALAAKDMLANFFGGLSVFADKPFKIGDYIVLDKGERGEVVEIGVRSTRIKTRDDILIAIPNSIIANSKIVNESAPIPNFRVRIPVSVAYGSDIDLVQQTLMDIAKENKNVIGDPAPRVRFREFGDSSLNFELLCWAEEPAARGRTVHELNCEIYKRFNESGIKFPFPQRDVHLYKEGQ
jgi:MscS family membrane protein